MASKTTDSRPDHVVFDELFRAARKEYRRITNEAAGPAHAAFLEFAQDRGWNWATDLATASLNIPSNHDDALALLTGCESQVPPEYLGYVHLVRGLILAEKGDFDGAIDANRKAVAQPGYFNPGQAWNNLGLCLVNKGDFVGAIEAYHKSLAQPGYDQPGYAWNNIGTALGRKRDLEGAIEAFHKALAQPGYDTPDYAWMNLGNALFLKGDLEGAIDFYRKAVAEAKYDTAARAWTSLAEAYAETGRTEQAREAFENALASPDKAGAIHARAREGLACLVPARSEESPASKRWWQFWK